MSYYIVKTNESRKYEILDGPFETRVEAVNSLLPVLYAEAILLLDESPVEIRKMITSAVNSKSVTTPIYVGQDVCRVEKDDHETVIGIQQENLNEDSTKQLRKHKALTRMINDFYNVVTLMDNTMSDQSREKCEAMANDFKSAVKELR